VPLLKSLFCLKGHDNGRRFLIISLVCYFLLIITNSILNQAAILIVLLLAMTTPTLLASTIRRIHDAGFATPLAAIPVVVYWMSLFGITYLEHGSRWTFLVLATITTLAMATISNAKIRRNNSYQMGYHGPVNLQTTDDKESLHNRIEPTIAGQKNTAASSGISQMSEQSSFNENIRADTLHQSPTQDSWEQQLGKWFVDNRQISIIAISVVLLITLVIAILPVFKDDEIKEVKIGLVQTNEQKQKVRLNKIEMPDQFWIMLDENDSLTIGWEGDIQTRSDLGENNSYWSAYTGKGDKTCVDLHFSLGADIKTLLVTVKNGGNYYADFSPTDTPVIVRSIANKDRFKLCGYEFVLKGTRSLLRKNGQYKQFLELN